MNNRVYDFNDGDRVVFVREACYYEPILVGSIGTVEASTSAQGTPYISRVTHATMNGGGYDLPVRLDDGRRVIVRAEGDAVYITRIGR